MRKFGLILLVSCALATGQALRGDEKPPAEGTLGADLSKMKGEWELPAVKSKDGNTESVARLVIFEQGIGFVKLSVKSQNGGAITESTSEAAFAFELTEKDKKRALMAKGKAFKDEISIGYSIDKDKLTLGGGTATLSNGVVQLKGEWKRCANEK